MWEGEGGLPGGEDTSALLKINHPPAPALAPSKDRSNGGRPLPRFLASSPPRLLAWPLSRRGRTRRPSHTGVRDLAPGRADAGDSAARSATASAHHSRLRQVVAVAVGEGANGTAQEGKVQCEMDAKRQRLGSGARNGWPMGGARWLWGATGQGGGGFWGVFRLARLGTPGDGETRGMHHRWPFPRETRLLLATMASGSLTTTTPRTTTPTKKTGDAASHPTREIYLAAGRA